MFNINIGSRRKLDSEFVFYNLINVIADLVVWSYFSILLLRESNNNFSIVVFATLFEVTGVQIGFTISSFCAAKVGYLRMYRFSNFLQAGITMLSIGLLPHILYVYGVITLLRGFAAGLYWETNHLLALGELSETNRSKAVSISSSLSDILNIVFPVLIGAILTVSGYEIVFMIGAAIYVVAAIYPWENNQKTQDNISWRDVKQVLHRRGMGSWAVIIGFEGFVSTMRGLVLAILPFVFIGQEFGVGLLTSGVALFGALFVLKHRNDSLRTKWRMGMIGSAIVLVSNIFLFIFWNLPFLVIRLLLSKLGFSLFIPAQTELTYYNKQLILGEFLHQDGNEVTLITESILFLGKLLGIAVFIFLFFVLNLEQLLVLQIMFAITIVREPLELPMLKWMQNKLKI